MLLGEVVFEVGDGDVLVVEDGGGEGGIGVAEGEGIGEVLHSACTAWGDEGDIDELGELVEGLVGEA